MASAIGPGDWVECVSGKKVQTVRAQNHIKIGAIHRVEATVEGACVCGNVCGGLVLFGKRSTHPTGGFATCAFRPVYRPKADLIESLKAPPISAPVRQSEDA